MNIERFEKFKVNEELAGIIEMTGLAIVFIWAIYKNLKKDKATPKQVEKEVKDNKVLKSLIDKVLEDAEIKELLKQFDKELNKGNDSKIHNQIKAKAQKILRPEEYKLIETYLNDL